MKSATVIRHIAFEDLGTLEIALERQGYTIKYLEAAVDNLTDISPTEDMLIILGGPIGAYDEQDYPFLVDELRLLEQRLKADLPTLGICLGAQLMARALGARVYPGGQKEIGWSNIHLSQTGKNSPLINLDVENTPVLHWHGDTFDLPQGATRLASSSLYENQAFSWGKASMGLQFHPEVTQTGLERWFIGHACEINSTPGISVKQLRADTVKYGHLLQEKAVEVWENWLESVQLVR
ncbi:GMP synthase family protein [Rivularia sp. PCC 7116]|uniref:glutamine amidotransferase n=1 Tax=Rivularia sp. PCC 7116 TaxID=373994 RepID=UPI00029F2316|nr:glutamine amidotransferase [Rivularia sp. PCC 7116]AFY54490.1 GMP synthase family protein [Rivularia sp. PCC 7116]